jgi:pre-mRNA-processing factor 39
MQLHANILDAILLLLFISSKQGVPTFSMYYAMFKEQVGDAPGARALFAKGSSNFTSDFYTNINRMANMEKRMVYTSFL